ncbi:MAG: depupylase/deamidase Dop [Myxococcota bacterium]|jgi:proteasome accessory factor A|nr:proteasome accessory factor PafA2 [Deltaproteobacteria bacterium]MCP4241989.1 proteasome accessory factor PafA2 [bacterium]MDP6075001.1 depupylase/deamidase Dop [Myxococcota bacterium]MBT38623.1 proteasome accessory factor PafA2 [Deltaproteobacteria bacterium]MDP7076240.1 depupylase/deamidase Dop [Myxococcota bacterium]
MAIPKVMGTEIEYGITVKGDPDFDPISSCVLLVNAYREDHAGEILWDYDQENPLADARGFQVDGEKYTPNQQENIARNKTLINGARYYVDHAHPEYSCPEVTSPRDLVVHEKAGERIMEMSRRESNALLPAGTQLLLYKNNSDRKGNSYGAHENFLMDRRTSFKQVVEHVTPFFVTRQVYTGAGKAGSENRSQPCNYQISQRADFFETEVALDTMVKRPIVNTRDEPHADREKYRRLHVIVGDANLSEYTIYLRTGVTAIVLSMIEDGAIRKSLSLRDPVRAIKEVSHDPTCRATLAMESGSQLTAVQIQREYLEMAERYLSGRTCEPWERDVLDKWADVLDALERDPMELANRIDWVMKKVLIESFMERKGLDWQAPQVQMLDLQYHDLRPDKGLYYMLEKQGRVERIVNDEEILAAVTTPPGDTRAYFRGECLRRYGSAVFGVNWDSISFSVEDEPIKRIMMAEPLKGSRVHVEELLDRSPTVADLVKNLRA